MGRNSPNLNIAQDAGVLAEGSSRACRSFPRAACALLQSSWVVLSSWEPHTEAQVGSSGHLDSHACPELPLPYMGVELNVGARP